jgi:retinol dehydrogenase-14
MTVELEGRTCVVTGATSGIGKEVARQLACRGARVFGVGRDSGRCSDAEQEIRVSARNPSVDFFAADLSSQAEIRKLAGSLARAVTAIDVLVNNAGVFTFERKETVDGLEAQLAVNWLAPFMLTGLLLPQLLRAPRSRVVTVSSGSHLSGTMHWSDLGLKRGYRGLKAYDQSKLAGVLFTYELARRIGKARTPAAHAVDPGLVKTLIAAKGNNRMVRLAWSIRTANGISPCAAAQSVVWCATEPAIGIRSGLYWKEKRALESSLESYDPAAARRLWKIGEELCGVRYP